jgi:hypothetical protein
MTEKRTLRFSLATLLLLMVIVALSISHWVLLRKMQEAQAEMKAAREEVANVRKHFGFLDIDDPKLIYVGRIESRSGAYRMRIPAGHRFLLHVTEMKFPDVGWPENPEPSSTMSMNSWREGADVVLQWRIVKEDRRLRFVVKTESEELFDYVLDNWEEGPLSNSSAYLVGPKESQKSFQPNETIRFMLFKNDSTNRGVMLWMEPLRKRYPQHP